MMKIFNMNPKYSSTTTTVMETESRLVSITHQINFPVDLIAFLLLAPPSTRRVYWENQKLDLAFAGFDIAAEIFASDSDRFATVTREIKDLFSRSLIESPDPAAMPRLFGGFAFQPDFQPEGIWQAFPAAYFMLPRYQISCSGNQTWLTINACVTVTSEIESLRAELKDLVQRLSVSPASSSDNFASIPSYRFSYPLEQQDWNRQINETTHRIKAGELEKVVLSRTCDVNFTAPVDPLNALSRLRERYPDTYRFLLEPLPGQAFFGATPELLISVNGRQIFTGALAGSIKRGATNQEDDQIAAQLFPNPKERHEHNLVVIALEDLLLPITSKLNVPEAPQILKLSNIQHLYSPITGELKSDLSVLEVVEKLHPTPALGGYPRQIAVETIRQNELIARGWYAAPVGWVDAQGNGVFAVAIRSAVSNGNQARLYAGVGIVADSDPDREWDETRLKFRPMLDALGVSSQV
ncbi:MAG TPA: isochorismate synthase [Phototrophicaceae bacterium]|jgi:menaquinone-specific isochorismate synthase|nr:isochorismate synthase [Phototrophicaceae bacterium]